MKTQASRKPMEAVGVFAGIGGFELGFRRSGHEPLLLVDNAPASLAVLRRRFPDVALAADIRDVRSLPASTELLAAGFPCQDLSSVGAKAGIKGRQSALVGEVFRLLDRKRVPWVVLENVPFLMRLDGGRALGVITRRLSSLGYAWAYRVIDTQAFGLPQRRRRWYLVASRVGDPRDVLLAGNGDAPEDPRRPVAHGFYWTEGTRALGWAVDSTPPLKAGSSVGVPSPPAILLTTGQVITPDIRDAERLQGFPANWTKPAESVAKPGYRWQLVGNAVSVNVAAWLGHRLVAPASYDASEDEAVSDRWPEAAWSSGDGNVYASRASNTPVWRRRPHLEEFLRYEHRPLSARAAAGFLSRAENASLRFPAGFLDQVRRHVRRQEDKAA